MQMKERLVLGDVGAARWEEFHAGRDAALSPELAVCWSRALSLGAPADGALPEDSLVRGAELAEHAGAVELVRIVGETVFERASVQVAARDFLLLLADPDGVVVRTGGGGRFADVAADVRLIEGACWSEAARGTNAIGTALVTNRPTEVHGHAHFGRSYGDLVCYAAPVRGLDGSPIAVLDATSRIERADAAVGATVTRAARALEELIKLQAYASAGASVTRVLGRSLDRMRDPALLIEAPGVVARASTSARELLGPNIVGTNPGAVLGLTWSELLAEALSPTAGGRPLLDRRASRRAWRLRVDPVAAPAGATVAMLVVLEPGRARLPVRASTTRPPPSDPFSPIFAEDATVVAAVEWSRRLARSDLPVMLLAETGAGKELFAHAIHAASPRAEGPWHAINCGSMAPSLLESELFGYAPGAFTGADRNGRPGLFHAASGGTLFLDEVAEMSPAMQASLLRVLETGAFRRVGDTRLERTDVRVVCATCRDLPALVAAGSFRQDLYYRLKGATVRIPSLRERTDVLPLAIHLLDGEAVLSPDAETAIAQYAWPGNVRELKSVLAVARVAASGGAWIERTHLPEEIAFPPCAAPSELDEIEREALVRALGEAGGNVSLAARRLGVARSTIHRMKRRHGLR
jgi:sigma-54 dependent transcriptional regulator, acetoin dehydrogenase operon transcriptional activator AcoR